VSSKRAGKRNTKEIGLCTHNILTGVEIGRREALAKRYEKEGIDIVGVQEGRITGNHEFREGGFAVFTTGHLKGSGLQGHHGTEIWIGNRLRAGVRTVERFSPRRIRVRVRLRKLDHNVGSGHAPPESRPPRKGESSWASLRRLESERKQFWRHLRTALRRAPRRSQTMVLIDANGSGGKGERLPSWGSRYPEKPNSNGQEFMEALHEQGLAAVGTFRWDVGPEGTWFGAPDGIPRRYDYVALRKELLGRVTMGGAPSALQLPTLGSTQLDHQATAAYVRVPGVVDSGGEAEHRPATVEAPDEVGVTPEDISQQASKGPLGVRPPPPGCTCPPNDKPPPNEC
jgi:hypothetical protein